MAAKVLRTFVDIQDAVREELKIQSTSTNDVNKIKRDINIVYDDVISRHKWEWLRKSATLNVPVYLSNGTANVTQNSRVVTLSSAASIGRQDYLFSVDGESEFYRIRQHTAGSTALELASDFMGATNSAASYKIWLEAIPLPSDCADTIDLWNAHSTSPLEGLGLQEMRRLQAKAQKAEGFPCYYSTTDWKDPTEYAAISGLPALSTAASAGLVKTLVFASSVTSYISVGDYIRIELAATKSFNCDAIVSSVSTTTITYTGITYAQISAAADATLVVKALSTPANVERYRELILYPALSNKATTLQLDYIKKVPALNNDADEPLIPISDRVVLLYGALARSWARQRSPEDMANNTALFEKKINQMKGKIGDAMDKPILTPSKMYIGAKRRGAVRRQGGSDLTTPAFGNGGGSTPTGTASTLAYFNSSERLQSHPVITVNATGDVAGLTKFDVDNLELNGNTLSSTNTNGDINVTPNGTGEIVLATAKISDLGAGVVQSSAAGVITSSTAVAGLTQLDVDNLRLDGNTVSSTDANGAINLTPNGTGQVVIATAKISDLGTGVVHASSTGVITSSTVVNADVNATAAIALTKLAATTASRALVSDASGFITPATTTSTEIGYVNGVTSAIQTQLNTKVTGPGSATDNAVVRWDGTTGYLDQNSVVIVSDAGAVTGVTALTVDNINVDGNTIISTDANGAINLTPNGTGRTNITRTTLVGTTASHVIINDGSGNVSSEASLAISRGGTGQATKTEGFDALAPTTTKGDIIVYNGSDNIRVAVGSNDQILIADSAQTSGVRWGAAGSIAAANDQFVLASRIFG